MLTILSQIFMFLLAAATAGALIGWLLHRAALNALARRHAALIPVATGALSTYDRAPRTPLDVFQEQRRAAEAHLEAARQRLTQAVAVSRAHHSERHDDLTKIDGIGPHTEQALNEFGITTYRQLAAIEQMDLARIEHYLGFTPDARQRQRWISHAQTLHAVKYRERI